jgi:hypothetical protein
VPLNGPTVETPLRRAGWQVCRVMHHVADEILSKLEAGGDIVWCHSWADLGDSIARTQSIAFARYSEPDCRIAAVVERFLQDARVRPQC